jgi:hypothetical protein
MMMRIRDLLLPQSLQRQIVTRKFWVFIIEFALLFNLPNGVMVMNARNLLVCVAVLALAGSRSAGEAVMADRILHNGRIVTVDANFQIAEAVAIRFSPAGSEIMAVGSNSEVMALRGPDTRVTDLQGRVVIPGLIDAHLHFSLLGIEAAFEADLRRSMTVSDVVQDIKRLAERRKPAAGQWLVGRVGTNTNTSGHSHAGISMP